MTFNAEEKQKIKDAWNQEAQAMRPKNVLKSALMRIFNEPKVLYGDGGAKLYSARQIAQGIDKNNKAGEAGLHFVEFWMSKSKSSDPASKLEDALKLVRRHYDVKQITRKPPKP